MSKIDAGTILAVRADGVTIKGTLLADEKNWFVLKGDDGLAVTILKSHIAFFMQEGVDEKLQELLSSNTSKKTGIRLLAQLTKKGKETGLYFIAAGDKLKESAKVFGESCEIDRAKYGVGDLGDFSDINPEKLKDIVVGTIIEEDTDENETEEVEDGEF